MDDIQQIGLDFANRILEYFKDHQSDALTQMYMRGCFAGFSANDLIKLATLLKDNYEKYPPYPQNDSPLSRPSK